MKRISIVLLVLMMWGVGLHAQHSNIISVENAWNIVKNEILKEKGDSICVYVSNVTKPPQAEIKTIKGSVLTPSFESWFFFVDDMPYANWEHSCRYIYVNAKTGNYEIQYMNRPPKDNMDVLVQYKPANKSNVIKKYNTPKKALRNISPELSEHKYAVIISGGIDMFYNKERYWNDCSEIYKTLIDVYNYPKNHIYVIMSDGTSPNIDRSLLNGSHDSSPLDLDGDGENDIQYAATKANIMNVFTSLGSILNSDDALFVYVTDHGGLENGHSYLYLWDDEIMYDNEFASELNKVNAGIVITCMAQCHSGGFIDHLDASNRVIATACKKNEVSFSTADEVYDEFVYHWTSAVRGITPDGVSVNADTNNDGIVSMHEAFNYATSHDTKSEHPQYSSTPSAWGDFVSLSENIITGDSILAAYGVYEVKPSTSLTTVWSIDNNSFSLTPSGHKCTVSYNQGNQYDTATLTATVMKDGVVLKTLTKQIVNIGSISGTSVLCAPSTYELAGLPDGYTVTWSIGGAGFSMIPSQQSCTVSSTDYDTFKNAMLTANIYYEGQLIRTLTKALYTHGELFVEGRQYAHSNGTGRNYPDWAFTIPNISQVVDGSEEEGEPIDLIVFPYPEDGDSIITAVPSQPSYASVDINPECEVKLSSKSFLGMNISFGTDKPSSFTADGEHISFVMPYHSWNYPFVINFTNEGGCNEFSLNFCVKSAPIHDMSIIFNVVKIGSQLKMSILNGSGEDPDTGAAYIPDWSFSIYKFETGGLVTSGTVHGEEATVDVGSWTSGIYIIRAVCNGQTYTVKVPI